MRLATYEINGMEQWGFVVDDPFANESSIVSPQELEDLLPRICRPTNYFGMLQPQFMGKDKKWPSDLVGFLKLGQEGMSVLKRMETFVKGFSAEQDYFLLRSMFHPISKVRMKSPIPRPRLYWGLVQNCPSFFRENPNRDFVNLFCQGHQRTQAACTGYDGTMVFYNGDQSFPAAFTCEMGVIIGKYGKNIPANEAMDYVFGYTNVIDATCSPLKHDFGERMGKDWYIDATGDWIGKLNDTMGAMGPYITTQDEVPNPYNLLSYSRQNGAFRDRGFSGELILGVERAIAFYSSFAALHPGDVIHMGSMQADGMLLTSDLSYGKEDSVEVEIEKLGAMRVHFVNPEQEDWRDLEDVGRTIHHADAVRDLIASGQDCLNEPTEFCPEEVRHFWTAFANSKSVEREENLLHLEDIPRMLNNPGRAVSANTNGTLARRSKCVKVGLELCAVVKKVAYKVSEEDAASYILGYSPMVVVYDQSLYEHVVTAHSTQQERILPSIYARWGDGYNVILPVPVEKNQASLLHTEMHLEVDGGDSSTGGTEEYIVLAEKMLSCLSQYLTLFPGDILSLGRTSVCLDVSEQHVEEGFTGRASIAGLGEIVFQFQKER